jgi:hypothetical protein
MLEFFYGFMIILTVIIIVYGLYNDVGKYSSTKLEDIPEFWADFYTISGIIFIVDIVAILYYVISLALSH